MQKAELDFINEKMKILIGAKGFTIGRVASMPWIGFSVGEVEYALHIQCAFRFRDTEWIMISDLDIYEPTEEIKSSPSFDWDTYDWDVQGFNRFDEWTVHWKKDGEEGAVEFVTVNNFGDLTIRFDNGMILEVFINNSQDECWRFFERNSKGHLVVTGQGIAEE